jgi:hypothetical protein
MSPLKPKEIAERITIPDVARATRVVWFRLGGRFFMA